MRVLGNVADATIVDAMFFFPLRALFCQSLAIHHHNSIRVEIPIACVVLAIVALGVHSAAPHDGRREGYVEHLPARHGHPVRLGGRDLRVRRTTCESDVY